MRLVDQAILIKISLKNRSLGFKYDREDCIEKISVKKLADDKYDVASTLKIKGYQNSCHFILDTFKKEILEADCDCPFFDKRDLCGHIATVCIYLEKTDIDHFPYARDLKEDRQINSDGLLPMPYKEERKKAAIKEKRSKLIELLTGSSLALIDHEKERYEMMYDGITLSG